MTPTTAPAAKLEADVFEYLNQPDNNKELLGRFLALTKTQQKYLAPAMDAIENNSGCTSPDEQFIISILCDYECGVLNPESAECHLAEYHESLEDTERWAKHFIARHPERFADNDDD
jgi:hypothetical protein